MSDTKKSLQPALQAAGHAGAMQSESGELFYKPTDPAEANFYQEIAAHHPDLCDITPQFYGTLSVNDEASGVNLPEGMVLPKGTDANGVKKEKDQLIVLKSALHGFAEPCVLDIKLGSQLWDDDAPQEKRDRLDKVSAETTSSTLSLRVAGMNVYDDSEKGERIVYDKTFGRNMKTENFETDLAKFFPFPQATDTKKQKDRAYQAALTLQYFLEKLKYIHAVLSKKEFVMRAASLLFVYEGSVTEFYKKYDKLADLQAAEPSTEAEPENEDEDEDEPTEDDIKDQMFSLTLIDFAHTRFVPGQGPDQGVLKGIYVLINTFEKYYAKYEKYLA